MSTTGLGLSAERVARALKDLGFTHVVWLPDSEANFMYQVLAEDPDLSLVQVCREAETMAVAFGLVVGGRQPVCLIQNTGFLESGDSLRGLALDLQFPLLLMIGYRGWQGGQPMTDSAGVLLEPTLRAWGIPYVIVESDEDVPRIGEAWRQAQARSGPVAVLIGREYR
ncbi:MAG TPA: thiamine pyrophosphate-binding protein [Chloroflexota bacterium]